MRNAFLASSLLTLILAMPVRGETGQGTIRGTVVDKDTKEPLVGVNVVLLGSKLGASTGADGRYVIPAVPPGIRTVEVRLVGYEPVTMTDIAVSPERVSMANVSLKQSAISGEGVTVTAGYFPDNGLSALGTIGFNAQEIRRSPGSANDVSRILMALPSVAAVSDNANDLAVRGGSPMENGFYVDGIPVPNINHFPSEGSTGGPIGILNIDFVDNVDFLTSGFSSAYGDRLSSVVDIRFKEGSDEKTGGKAFLSFAGFGADGEGPLPGSSGSWMLSGSKSYLDLLVGAIGTGAAPQYGDLQGKAVIDIDTRHRLEVLDIFGDSRIAFSRENAIDLGQRYYGTNKNLQNTLGVSWRALWNSRFTSATTLSLSTTRFRADFSKVNSGVSALRSDNRERSFTFRTVNYLMLGRDNRLEFGGEARYDEGQFDYVRLGDTTRLGTVDPDYTIHRTLPSPKIGLFVTAALQPLTDLAVNVGMRADLYSLNDQVTLAPRVSLAYRTSDVVTLKANGGIFYQQIPLIALSSNDRFSRLNAVTAYHVGVGLEYLLTPDTRLTIDGYDKEYSNLPLDPADPTLSVVDDALFNQRFSAYADLQSTGRGYTRGLEMILQKKMARDLYGLVSASYFRSRYSDFNGVWRNRVYDNRFLFSVIAGYRPNDQWEVSVRWTYAGGRPYTPFDARLSEEANIGILDQGRTQAERYPDYHSMNIRVDRKFYFARHALDVYLSIWNAYNRKNVSTYFWNETKNTLDAEYQWSILPVVGVEYEF